MGRFITLPGVNPGTDRPLVTAIDALQSAGSLFLADLTHPANPFPAGVPVDLATVPNIMSANAQTLTGVASNLDGIYRVAGMDGTQKGKVERSAKGGLHAIYSNTHATNITTSNSVYARLDYGSAIRDYLAAHYTDRSFFVSLWTNATRLAPSGKQFNALNIIASTTSSSGNFKNTIGVNGISDPNDGERLNRHDVTYGLGPKINNTSRFGYSVLAAPNNQIPTTAAQLLAYAFQVGNWGTMNSYSTAKEGVPSAVLYRAYIEDLTVSGRTYAQVDALDFAEYTKQVLTPGGRYYGDTVPTDPATIP